MLLWKAYRRNPLFLGLHETIDRYMKSVLRKQHAFEQFFLLKSPEIRPFVVGLLGVLFFRLTYEGIVMKVSTLNLLLKMVTEKGYMITTHQCKVTKQYFFKI